MQFNSQLMYMLMKSKQMNASAITPLIFEPCKICLAIYTRYSIWETKNVSTIHRSIPYNYRTYLDDEETESSPQTLQPRLIVELPENIMKNESFADGVAR